MSYETITVEKAGPVMRVRLNRPEKRNAINAQMHSDIQAVCRQLSDDCDTRVVVLSGEGLAFSSGADTSEWGQARPDNELLARRLTGTGGRTAAALESLDQITIAAIHGFAVGGAVVFALCCDFRVASRSTWFSIPEVELGIPLTWNALPRLARAVGHARALELTVLCERFSAQQAYDYGLATHLVPDGEHMNAGLELAAKIVAKPALPVALTKATMKAIRRGTEIGEVTYSDSDLLLYNRLMRQEFAKGSQSDRQ